MVPDNQQKRQEPTKVTFKVVGFKGTVGEGMLKGE